MIDLLLLQPFSQLLREKLGVQLPSHTLQIQITYYREPSTLELHRDKGFFQGIIGPATGLKIRGSSDVMPKQVSLEKGDVLFYSGFAFQDALQKRGQKVPEPLLHGVEAEAGRMSILFNSFPRTN